MSPLDDILEQLQKLPSQYRWALTDRFLLVSIYRKIPLLRTGRLYLLTILVRLCRPFGMVWPLIYLIGTVELVKLLVKQHVLTKNKRMNGVDYPACFFVGFGIAKESEIIPQYSRRKGGGLGILHQYKIETFACWHRVGVISGFRSLIGTIALAKQAMAVLPVETADWYADFLVYIGSKVGYYAYARAWFAILVDRAGSGLEEVAFSCQNQAAFAAVDAGIRTVYFSHGTINRCELLPAFTTISTLTADEAEFVRHRLPMAHVTVQDIPRKKLAPSQMAREILIATCLLGVEYIERLDPLMRWAEVNKIPVRVRLHPAERIYKDHMFVWAGYVNAGLVTIEDGDVDFFKAIDRVRPRLLVSWNSTTLADVLQCGVIPVTACLDDAAYMDDDLTVAEMAYPFFRRCLKLPNAFESIERLFHDDEYYESVLSRLIAE